MNEYLGFKYKFVKDLTWKITYPSGFKATVQAVDEDLIKRMIDNLISEFKKDGA